MTEKRARAALVTLRSALDWLEDSPYFESAHQALDDAGRTVRERFGCRLRYDKDKGYSQTCPVALTHTRVGLSPAFVVEEVECSICGSDPEDCEHVTGRRYGEEVCHRVVTQAEVFEMSLVSSPREPDARTNSISVTRSELKEETGLGVPVQHADCMQPMRPSVSRNNRRRNGVCTPEPAGRQSRANLAARDWSGPTDPAMS